MNPAGRPDPRSLRRIRLALAVFTVGLVVSGLTAFPLEWELSLLARVLDADLAAPPDSLRWWIARVHDGLAHAGSHYPFLAYGTDWLAFGHLVIALFFIGPWRDPVANAWVLRVGLVACAAVLPLALVCGAIRGIPIYWRLLDCAFGVVGALPLLYALREVRRGAAPKNL